MPIKLFLSQANQGHNAGPLGYTEKAGMDAISRSLATILAEDPRFAVKRNVAGNRIDTASANAHEANAWGADYYLALHSNAGEKGTVVFHSSTSKAGKRLATALYNAVAKLSPGKEGSGRIRVWDGLIEIHTPHAPAVLIELEAHDWATGVKWLLNRKPIARALYDGICTGVGLAPLPEKPVLTGKTLTVPIPVDKPAWWPKLVAYMRTVK